MPQDRFEKLSVVQEETIKPNFDMRIDFIRHGKPNYDGENEQSGEVQGRLDEDSRIAVRQQAERFITEIDAENELVVVYSSPKTRSIQTAEVWLEALKTAGIPALKLSGEEKKVILKLRIGSVMHMFLENLWSILKRIVEKKVYLNIGQS